MTPSPSGRAHLARRVLTGALLLGVLADPLLRNGPWGVGLIVWMTVFGAVTIVLVRGGGGSLSNESVCWLGIATLFAAGPSWRDSEILQFFDVVAMLTALGLLAMSCGTPSVPRLVVARIRDLIDGAVRVGRDVAFGLVPLLWRDTELHTLRPSDNGPVRRIARAMVITAPILLVFTLLLTSADPVFGSFLTFPDVRLDVAISHVVIAGFFAWIVAGWLRHTLLSHDAPADTTAGIPFPLTLSATDVTLALGALNVLFAAFVAVQVGWLFGGEGLVLRTTGLSYAQYARRGFFELMWVAGLLLPVLLGAQALIPASDTRTLRLYRRLSVPLVLLLGAIMLSAGARMRLYVQYYGISTDRLYATAFMFWLAIVFAWLALTVLRSRSRTFAAGLIGSGYMVLLTLNVLNPDALVARSNLARSNAERPAATGADLQYLASLGGDAVPMLVTALTASGNTADTTSRADRCAAAQTLLNRWTGEKAERVAGNWPQWNHGRLRARNAVLNHETELRALACPGTL